MDTHWDKSTINEFIFFINKINKIKDDFYKNIYHLFNDNNLKRCEIFLIVKQISDICLNISVKISKFEYKLHEQNGTILYNKRDLEKYCILGGHDIIQLRNYDNEITILINRFKSKFNLQKYDEISENKIAEGFEFGDKYFNQKQLIKNLSKKLKFFMNSENHKLIFKISDVLYNYENDKRDLDEMLEIYKNNMKCGEKYMMRIRIYIYLIKQTDININEISKLESNINEYILNTSF